MGLEPYLPASLAAVIAGVQAGSVWLHSRPIAGKGQLLPDDIAKLAHCSSAATLAFPKQQQQQQQQQHTSSMGMEPR